MSHCCTHCHQDPCCCQDLTVPALPIESIPACTSGTPTEASLCSDLSIGHPFEEVTDVVLPASGGTISLPVKDTCHWRAGTCVVISDGTNLAVLQVTSVDSSANSVSLTNQGYAGNPAGGTVFTNPIVWFRGECPSGTGSVDPICADLNLQLSEAFTIPSAGSTGLLHLDECVSVEVGQGLYVENYGTVKVVSVDSNDPTAVLEVQTVCLLDGVTAGDTVGSGSYVVTHENCVSLDPLGGLSGLGNEATPLLIDVPSFLLIGEVAAPGTSIVTVTQNYDPNAAPTNLVGGGDAAPVECPLTDIVFDKAGGADIANNGWVVPEDGEYFLWATAQVDEASAAGGYSIRLGINDTHVLPGMGPLDYIASPITEDVNVMGLTQTPLSEGDVVKVYLMHNTAGGIVQTSSASVEWVYLAGWKIQK